MARLRKPAAIKNSPFKNAKWNELVKGREFTQADVPTLSLLCQWYEVIEKCMDDISIDGNVQVAYQNEMGDLRALPQLSTMKQASAEIRALSKQLGISEGAEPAQPKRKETTLYVIQANRKSRAASARGA